MFEDTADRFLPNDPGAFYKTAAMKIRTIVRTMIPAIVTARSLRFSFIMNLEP
jgi:hypothetical protein